MDPNKTEKGTPKGISWRWFVLILCVLPVIATLVWWLQKPTAAEKVFADCNPLAGFEKAGEAVFHGFTLDVRYADALVEHEGSDGKKYTALLIEADISYQDAQLRNVFGNSKTWVEPETCTVVDIEEETRVVQGDTTRVVTPLPPARNVTAPTELEKAVANCLHTGHSVALTREVRDALPSGAKGLTTHEVRHNKVLGGLRKNIFKLLVVEMDYSYQNRNQATVARLARGWLNPDNCEVAEWENTLEHSSTRSLI